MSLFNKKTLDSIPFDKERIKEEILKSASEKAAIWTIFPSDQLMIVSKSEVNKTDLLCIRSIPVNKEISITSNPFSHYRRVEPSVYQIVVGIYITQEETGDFVDWRNDWRILCVNSADMLFRKLEEQS